MAGFNPITEVILAVHNIGRGLFHLVRVMRAHQVGFPRSDSGNFDGRGDVRIERTENYRLPATPGEAGYSDPGGIHLG
jgi:hypothetical protein